MSATSDWHHDELHYFVSPSTGCEIELSFSGDFTITDHTVSVFGINDWREMTDRERDGYWATRNDD